ncbi:hypothetical protein [Carboxylicivirga sp. M1479]|uniref:hypothetical protein n=1 Tax=Carboxylicivirga sp. M1479 TaxID=2594476 RepID=UPI001177DB52|nr:hypothetical protein [Carboxylicivirga sp. M1479]TRX71997.1 hypothetical protein FNN09_03050 [Carboxylicivirga sp. M1479]
MKNIKLKFSFKGKRSYVQGPDIFDAVVDALALKEQSVKNIKYSAHNWIRNNATLILDPEEEIEKYDSLITYYIEDVLHKAYVVDNGVKIDSRSDYSEDYVFSNSEIEGDTIKLNYNTKGYTFSELVVSMNKCYMQDMHSEGKWIVTKFEYATLDGIADYMTKDVTILLQKNLNNKLTKSEILINNKPVGYIYFSLV